MRVLIAEDDAGVRSVLERGLTEEGYVCDTAAQGDDALHLLRIYDYAAAVLDWRMPGLSGEEVAREARKLRIRTPIPMLTARDCSPPAERQPLRVVFDRRASLPLVGCLALRTRPGGPALPLPGPGLTAHG